MLKNRLLLGLALVVGILAACEKPEAFDEKAQLEIDETIIKDWAIENKVTLTKHETGLYYRIITPGTGSGEIAITDTIVVEYEGRLMTDSVFSKATTDNPYRYFKNTAVPEWWATGLSLIKPGGRIQLLVPSGLAYKNYPTPGVPANSVLHFNIIFRKIGKKVDKQI